MYPIARICTIGQRRRTPLPVALETDNDPSYLTAKFEKGRA